MMIPFSQEFLRALREAEDIAHNISQPLSTAHVLLALFTYSNRAHILMKERQLDEDCLLDFVDALPFEQPHAMDHIKKRAMTLAVGAQAAEVNSLHLLVALLRERETNAFRLLALAGVAMAPLRNQVLAYMTNPLPRRMNEHLQPLPPLPPLRIQSERSAVLPLTRLAEPSTTALKIEEAGAAPYHATVDSGGALSADSVSRFVLSARDYPLLNQIGLNWCVQVENGAVDPLIGRDKELTQVVDILGRRRANNPCLVGPPGVGKTAIVQGLAHAIVMGRADLGALRSAVVIEISVGSLLSGTSLRGALSERILKLQKEVAQAAGRVIVFIDEIHMLIGAGSSPEGAQDIANELKSALARGEFPCIGATTESEYKKYIESDPAIERRFTVVSIEEPSAQEAADIVTRAIAPYEQHHGVSYSAESLLLACRLSERFIPERRLPDKAFALIDRAGSRVRRLGRTSVEVQDIAEVVAEMKQVPLQMLLESEQSRLLEAETHISRTLVGHAPAVTALCRALWRGAMGMTEGRPYGSFLFLGPSGVGKTELARVLAEFLLGSKEDLLRIDLSEYSESHSISRLIGSPPGYVGYQEGGLLTDAVRHRPLGVILFDEIEKAHPAVLQLLLQVLDTGKLTDSHGRSVKFGQCVIIMTSNVGAQNRPAAIGFEGAATPASYEAHILKEAARALSAELYNRIGDKLVFHPLSVADKRIIAHRLLDRLVQKMATDKALTLSYDENVPEWLVGHCLQEPGVRSLRDALEREIEAPIANALIHHNVRANFAAHLTLADSVVQIQISHPAAE